MSGNKRKYLTSISAFSMLALILGCTLLIIPSILKKDAIPEPRQIASANLAADPFDPFSVELQRLDAIEITEESIPLGAAPDDLLLAIQLQPRDPDYYSSLGTLCFEKGLFDLAIRSFDQAIQLNPRDAMPMLLRSKAYLHLNKTYLALDDLDRAIRLDPTLTEAYVDRGEIFLTLGEAASALADFEVAVARDPADPESRYNRGLAKLQLGNYQQAEQNFGFVIQKVPELTAAYDLLAQSSYQNQNFRKAAVYWEKYLSRTGSTEDARIYHNLGLCFVWNKEYEKAVECLTTAIKLEENLDVAYFNRGIAYLNLEQLDEAASDFETVCLLSENSELLQESQNVLQFLSDSALPGSPEMEAGSRRTL